MCRHPIKAKRQIRGHTLPPLENNSRNKNNEVRSSLFLYICGASISVIYTVECTVLPNTENPALLCLYIIKQKQVMAQY